MRLWHDALARRLLMGVAWLGCALSAQAHDPSSSPSHPRGYLALGDSYTIGEGVAEAARWPAQLVAALRDDGIALDAPRYVATTGWTTDELSAAIDTQEPLGTFAFVSLAIGVNNQYRGRDVDDYGQEFAALLQRAIGFAGGHADHVLVLGIPDWGATVFGQSSGRDRAQIATQLDAYNATARAICAASGVAFVDVSQVSRAHGADSAMLVDDGLHPSAAMYAQWVRLALPVAHGLLKE